MQGGRRVAVECRCGINKASFPRQGRQGKGGAGVNHPGRQKCRQISEGIK